jgi:phage anti-repressor protein
MNDNFIKLNIINDKKDIFSIDEPYTEKDMLEATPRGKRARQYFIDLEKSLNPNSDQDFIN